MKYEEKIHSKQYRVLANQLNDPEKPIVAILHVNQVTALAPLAEKIELLSATLSSPESLIRALDPQLRDQTLFLSFPEHVPKLFSSFSIPNSAIRPSAWSKVIYMPPFYLAFTPGLFDAVAKELSMNASGNLLRRKSSLRFKM